MKEITIVTAFFDIDRKNIKDFNRDNQKYLDAFKFWARIRNNIVVYSDSKTIKEVKKIRREYGLEKQTKTVVIDDFLNIDRELYDSINNAMKKKEFIDFHMQTNIPEVRSAKYNYIMALKSWICSDAIKKGYTTDMVCWLDFGFNYGGKFYRKSEEFDFEWKWNFSDKIHLLQVNDFDDLPVFEIIRRNNSYVQGGEIVAPKELWGVLWKMVRENMISLCKCGFPDDDQILYLMSYRENKNLFEIHKCEWLALFKDFCDRKFTFKRDKINKFKNFLHKCKHPNEFMWIRKINYAFRTYNTLKKFKLKG